MTLLQESKTAAGVAMDAVLKRSILLCLGATQSHETDDSSLLIRVSFRHLLAFHTHPSSATWPGHPPPIMSYKRRCP